MHRTIATALAALVAAGVPALLAPAAEAGTTARTANTDPAAGPWKQCSSGTKSTDTIVTGDYGVIDVLTRPGQSCKLAIKKERWLRVDRGGLTDGWRIRSYTTDDVEEYHYYTVVFAKGKTRIKMIQYCED